MNKTIAFDVDGTLIKKSETGRDVPRYEIIHLLYIFQSLGYKVLVWSVGGKDYAHDWVEKLGLENVSWAWKTEMADSWMPDIAVDDEEVTLGKVNIKV